MSKKIADAVWFFGVKVLEKKGVQNARSLIGQGLKESDEEDVLDCLTRAHKEKVVDPVSWIQKSLKARPAPAQPDSYAGDAKWPLRVKKWNQTRFWSESLFGPKPGEPGCMVPPELLEGDKNSMSVG